jgi:hypothetical protein
METTTMEIVEFPQRQIVTADCRLSNNGWDEAFPKQQIAEHMRPNLGELCLVSGPQNTYIGRELQN